MFWHILSTIRKIAILRLCKAFLRHTLPRNLFPDSFPFLPKIPLWAIPEGDSRDAYRMRLRHERNGM